MIDIRFLRENPEAVKENIRKKFQDAKLPLVDEVVDLDAKRRAAIAEVESLKAARNKLSKANGPLYGQLKKCDDEAKKAELQAQIDRNNAAVKADDDRRAELDQSVSQMDARIREIMYVIPNIIDPSVPIGPDDSCNVEVERFGDPVVPTFEIPHHVDIMASFNGIDKESAGRVAGMGFYYLLGDIARLHEAVLAYARDFMIDEKGFTYVIPPFMMHGDVVKGVMSFPEMEAMMYKIEGEDLYLIGTSEHTMIGRFIDQVLPEAQLPLTLTSYSPCFRKEVGSHGLEERGVYRIHQFEKQEMIVVCKPEESMDWYNKLWKNSVELFRNLRFPSGSSSAARVILPTSRSSPATLRRGAPASRNISRSAPARTSATRSRGVSASASRVKTARPIFRTRSTTPASRRPECSSRSWKTICRKTAR